MGSKYIPVQDDEKFQDILPPRRASSSLSETTLLEDEERAIVLPTRSAGRYGPRWVWIVHAVLLGLSLTMFVCSWFARVRTLDYVRQFSAYSPAAKVIEYETVKFNTTIGASSAYVGKGEEVDKAWHAISYDIGDQAITPEELKLIDMPESSLKVKHPKTGREGYRVGLEVFHQLHCLNLLRQVTYKEHYTEVGNSNFASGDEDLQMHTDHCIEILRLNIQCDANVGLFTFYMEENDPYPWPQLDSWHKCRNFDKVKEWALDNTVGNMEAH